MLFTYNIVVRIYFALIYLASAFNKKASLWVKGRKSQKIKPAPGCIWFHFASLGEFEQGRPVLEALKQQYPEKPIVITFFSPSGFQVRKNTPLAQAVYYLPLDTAYNARRFVDILQPDIAVFTKYEYWYHYFNQLHQRQIPLYIISGIFRPTQAFFKWYGGLHRKMLTMVNHFFVQDQASQRLLQTLAVNNVTVSGDTRFDRVWANAQSRKKLPGITEFKDGHQLFIAGSTWPQDEELLLSLINKYPDWKFIIAPHEIGEAKIERLLRLLSSQQYIRFTQMINYRDVGSYRVLVVDNMGTLSSLYQYADVAYIGGGFGAGIHNTLEAAAFGLPVIFGPKYQKFKEARDLISLKAGFTISNVSELKQAVGALMDDPKQRASAAEKAQKYVEENTGATASVLGYIKASL